MEERNLQHHTSELPELLTNQRLVLMCGNQSEACITWTNCQTKVESSIAPGLDCGLSVGKLLHQDREVGGPCCSSTHTLKFYIKCNSWHHYHNEVLPLEIWWDRRREGTWWCHWPTGASRTWWRFHRRWWTLLEISPSLPRLTNTFQPEDLERDVIS